MRSENLRSSQDEAPRAGALGVPQSGLLVGRIQSSDYSICGFEKILTFPTIIKKVTKRNETTKKEEIMKKNQVTKLITANIKRMSKREVLKVLFDNATPMVSALGKGPPLSDSEATGIVGSGNGFIGVIIGAHIQTEISGDSIDLNRYGRLNGIDKSEAVVAALDATR